MLLGLGKIFSNPSFQGVTFTECWRNLKIAKGVFVGLVKNKNFFFFAFIFRQCHLEGAM